MRTLVLLGCDAHLTARIEELLPAGWAVEQLEVWTDLVRRLSSEAPPDLLFFTSKYLNDDVRRSVIELRKRRYFVPASVYLVDPNPLAAHFAGRMHRHGIEPIFGPSDLRRGVAELLDRAAPLVGAAIARMLATPGGVGERLLALLESDPTMIAASPQRLAHALGTSRSALYRGLQNESLPPPGELQALFRLWPGVLRIWSGGRGVDAAVEAGSPHYPSFRKAVATHFGLTIREVRRAESPAALLRRWTAFQRQAQAEADRRNAAEGFGAAAEPEWSGRTGS